MYRILPLFTLNLLDFTHFYQKSTSFFGFQKSNRFYFTEFKNLADGEGMIVIDGDQVVLTA